MARIPITVMGYRCERCEYEWIPRGETDTEPKVCARCKSPYWNRARKSAPATTYEHFRARVRKALEQAGRPLTWTEVRTAARLPQALPNNKWVRTMETDIGLRREKNKGVIHWSLTKD
jgi:hypothetical protein